MSFCEHKALSVICCLNKYCKQGTMGLRGKRPIWFFLVPKHHSTTNQYSTFLSYLPFVVFIFTWFLMRTVTFQKNSMLLQYQLWIFANTAFRVIYTCKCTPLPYFTFHMSAFLPVGESLSVNECDQCHYCRDSHCSDIHEIGVIGLISDRSYRYNYRSISERY